MSFLDDDDVEVLQTNGLSDRNTIVDMSLRMDRFVVLVAIALASAFTFSYFTSSRVYLTEVVNGDDQKISDTVELYNTIFGYVLYAGGKVFEVFCETLIFPTLTTYLHNCSLYPGDQPARVHSPIKVRAIFWGLKTVIILMNVAFASVFVGRGESTKSSSRRLSAEEFGVHLDSHLLPIEFEDETSTMLNSIFRTSMTGYTDVEAVGCGDDLFDEWNDATDSATVSLGFPVHDWNAQLDLDADPTAKMELPLAEYLRQGRSHYVEPLKRFELQPHDIYDVFKQGQSVLMNGQHFDNERDVESFDDLMDIIAQRLNSTMSDLDLERVYLQMENRQLTDSMEYFSLTLTISRTVTQDGDVLCGSSGCVFAVDALDEDLEVGIAVAPFNKGCDRVQCYVDTGALLTVGVDRTFESTGDNSVSPFDDGVQEILTLSFGKLSWRAQHLHIHHDIFCDPSDGNECVGLSIPLQQNQGVLLVGEGALATEHRRDSPLQLVHVSPGSSLTAEGELKMWYPITKTGRLQGSHPEDLMACASPVDAYLRYVERNRLYFTRIGDEMYTAALFYLLQDGMPTHYQDVFTRRLALAATSSNLTDIEIAVPSTSYYVTVLGCVAMVVLMIFVIGLPTPRVKLSPNTTPAAQYVQILTDDSYPDIVHKKRLRFTNGDCLLFNEYVVDSIILHAERNHNKRIYL